MKLHPFSQSLRSFGFIAVGLLTTNSGLAQPSSNQRSASAGLEQLDGFTQTYYYSPGHRQRAQAIATLMDDAGKFFGAELQFTPSTTLYILSPTHWKDYAAPPLKEVYGFPHNIDESRLAIAAVDNDFWRSFLPAMDQLPASLAAQVTKAYHSDDGFYSMRPFFDLLAIHEMGHSYTAQAGLMMQRHWMSELFVNIMLHTYVAEKHPELLPALETFPNMVISAGTNEYKYTGLEDFEELYPTLGMGPRNYGWYQSKLHSAAKDIYNAGGKDVLHRLWIALKMHQEKMTDEELIAMLAQVHTSVANVFLSWN